MICPECGKDIDPRWEDCTFDYEGPCGRETHDPGSYWACPGCDTALDYEPEPPPEPDYEWDEEIGRWVAY